MFKRIPHLVSALARVDNSIPIEDRGRANSTYGARGHKKAASTRLAAWESMGGEDSWDVSPSTIRRQSHS
jgi:hypothetical protein